MIPLSKDVSLAVNSVAHCGTHVLDRNWDVLVTLDTYRVDGMKRLVRQCQFIDTVDKI
jgi:hypothetical protein